MSSIPDAFVAFHGEEVLHSDRTVTYITALDKAVNGTLVLTNFRLLFEVRHAPKQQQQQQQQHVTQCTLTWLQTQTQTHTPMQCQDDTEDHVQLPLGTIEKFEKMGGSTSRGQFAYGIEIQSKVCCDDGGGAFVWCFCVV